MSKVLPERNDVLPERRAPKHIRKFLMDVGGVNPWGENRYRLVLAEHVMIYVGARWHDWDESVALLDQGGLEFSKETRTSKTIMRDPLNPKRQIAVEADVPATVKVKDNQPIRVVEEMRWIPRYTDIKGWLLQVWYPESFYSRQHYEVTVKGRPDLPLLGEFPTHGQYERQFFYQFKGKFSETFPNIPSESWMEKAIQHHERKIVENSSASVEYRMVNTLNELKRARESYERKQRAEFELRVRERLKPIFSNTLEGGRIREQLARRCRELGIQVGHVGN